MVNHKFVQRLCAKEGLALRRKQPKRWRIAVWRNEILRTKSRNEHWAVDFMHDSFIDIEDAQRQWRANTNNFQPYRSLATPPTSLPAFLNPYFETSRSRTVHSGKEAAQRSRMPWDLRTPKRTSAAYMKAIRALPGAGAIFFPVHLRIRARIKPR